MNGIPYYIFNGDHFIFSPDYVIWHGDILQPRWLDDYPALRDLHIAWYEEKSVEDMPEFTFSVNSKAPFLDNYQSGIGLDLYSARLVQQIAAAGVRFETFPVKLIDRKTKQPLELGYRIFHLQEIQSGRGDPAPVPLFRLLENAAVVIIHREFKAVLDREKITGCNYELLTFDHSLARLLKVC